MSLGIEGAKGARASSPGNQTAPGGESERRWWSYRWTDCHLQGPRSPGGRWGMNQTDNGASEWEEV